MAVVLDAVGTQSTSNSVTTKSYTGLTIGTGANRALVVSISWGSDPGAITLARWDDGGTNQDLTLIQTATSAGSPSAQVVKLYGLVAPTSGNKTLKFTWTNSHDVGLNGIAWTGVNQTGGVTSFPNSGTATGNTTLATIGITIPTNGAGVSSLATGNAAFLNSVSATQLWKVSGTGGDNWESGGSYSTSSGTFTGSLSGTDQWAIVATGIAEATGGGGGTTTQRAVQLNQAVNRAATW